MTKELHNARVEQEDDLEFAVRWEDDQGVTHDLGKSFKDPNEAMRALEKRRAGLKAEPD